MPSNLKFRRSIKVSLNESKVIEDLRMIFRVERIVGDAYAKLKIDIYNVSATNDESGEAAFRAGDSISIDAGYVGSISTIFKGTVRNVQTIKQGVDTITTIFASDINEVNESLVAKSFRNQTSLVSLISDIAFEADIDIAELSIKPQNIKGAISYAKRFSLIMENLSRTYDFSWYIFNTELYVYDNDSANSAKEILIIDASTGLLESPVLTQKGIDVKMLLEPSIRPSDRYEVRSGGLQFAQGNLEVSELISFGLGLQHALSVVHTGDTHGGMWFTEIEGQNRP